MKVEILDEAQNDLLDGFRFYENQSEGLGDYFLDSLFSDIDSLQIYAGFAPLYRRGSCAPLDHSLFIPEGTHRRHAQ